MFNLCFEEAHEANLYIILNDVKYLRLPSCRIVLDSEFQWLIVLGINDDCPILDLKSLTSLIHPVLARRVPCIKGSEIIS